MPAASTNRRIAAVRQFNRSYTQRIGVLSEGLYGSPWSLTQVRLLYELAVRGSCTAAELCRDLGLDPGYVSRVMRDFARRRFLVRRPCEEDRRVTHLSLSAAGRKAFAPLDAASRAQVAALLRPLSPQQQDGLLEAMARIGRLLQPASPRRESRVVLRQPRPGDIGWVIQRHGALYAREYGWDARFEALVAEICVRFLREADPSRERCWIAELEGEKVGSVFVVKAAETVAQLRMLLVEPHARGRGIGERLVQACMDFARRRGYATLMLWTNSVLDDARRLYVAKGFRLVEEEPHREFGENLVGQNWELAL